MKRASYIALIATVLLALAAAAWLIGLFRKPLAPEPSLRGARRRERLVQSHELRVERRRERARTSAAVAQAFMQANGLVAYRPRIALAR